MADGDFGGLCENGHDVPRGARFCPSCGSPAHAPSVVPGQQGPASKMPPPPGVQPGPPPWGRPGQWPGPPPPYGWHGYGPPAYGPRSGWHGPPPAGAPPTLPSYWAYGPAGRMTNGLAIASMVLGILWIWWIGSVLAVILGHVALHQIRRSGQSGRGMAIAGVVLGYVGLAFVLLVVSLALA